MDLEFLWMRGAPWFCPKEPEPPMPLGVVELLSVLPPSPWRSRRLENPSEEGPPSEGEWELNTSCDSAIAFANAVLMSFTPG